VILFLTPWAIGVTVFFIYPLLATVYFSFTNYNGLDTADFVGFRNFVYLFTGDPVVKTAAANTLGGSQTRKASASVAPSGSSRVSWLMITFMGGSVPSSDDRQAERFGQR
jgi:hypothetical protein